MEIALKELGQFLVDGKQLHTGRPLQKFGGMLPREMVANWLICAVFNSENPDSLEFHSDPTGGDGLIHNKTTGETFLTEHVVVPNIEPKQPTEGHQRILDAINQKNDKGASYARGKTLVVFLNAALGEWKPTVVARALPNPLHFESVWAMGFQGIESDEYVYGVANLHLDDGDAPTFIVRIPKDLSGWKVERIQ